MKTILGEFIHCQMLFHAKALELYTLAYQHTMAINEQEQTQVCLYISVCLSVCPTVCLSVCPTVCLSTQLSVCLSNCLSVCKCMHMCKYVHLTYVCACMHAYIEIKILVFLLFVWCVHVRTYVCTRCRDTIHSCHHVYAISSSLHVL